MELIWVKNALALIEASGIRIEPALTDSEFAAAEETYQLCFPPDLRLLLGAGLPVGTSWPNWRDLDSDFIRGMLDWPFDGMCFDIKNDAFWMREWGEKPNDLELAMSIAQRAVAAAPRLVPIFGHRYLPCEPCIAGNPVLSVYQTDIIYYGSDLADYVTQEFGPREARTNLATISPRSVRFWSDVVEQWRPN